MPRLRVGDTIENFSYENALSQKKSFHEILTGPTILWFMRYIGCTACQVDLHDLEQQLPELKRRGIQVVIVLQSTPQSIRQQRPEGMPFEVICDPEGQLYRKFDVHGRQELLDAVQSELAHFEPTEFVDIEN